ncbi:MAG: DUF1080 domain-containing protein [Acidobacteriia bacterium]|nr:DUF1080 domain-containing protein [Terriglobia bacterium]MYG02457.1 DUF1080 domain-containing protein [Terriglobia bacterium]MYK11829.1 DUF1080 domain-containing protein [Terriglobia bacterium]
MPRQGGHGASSHPSLPIDRDARVRGDWVDLFDGKTLQGWRQQNGTATYRVADGAIVGETADGIPNPFLCTTGDYGDFEMEFDGKVRDRLNTGIIARARERQNTVREGRNNHRGREVPELGDASFRNTWSYDSEYGCHDDQVHILP